MSDETSGVWSSVLRTSCVSGCLPSVLRRNSPTGWMIEVAISRQCATVGTGVLIVFMPVRWQNAYFRQLSARDNPVYHVPIILRLSTRCSGR